MSAEALARLLHVSGVLGSFTCAESGLVLAASMPEQFSPAALEGTAARVANLLATAGPDAGLRTRLAATVVAQMPEASLR